MPDKVRIIQRKDERYDDYIRSLVNDHGFGHERVYAGVATKERADEIRRRLRTAGKHLGVAVKVFYELCPKRGRCGAGDGCVYHVRFSAFRNEDARAYKAGQSRRSA